MRATEPPSSDVAYGIFAMRLFHAVDALFIIVIVTTRRYRLLTNQRSHYFRLI